jgi:hypothetical protein
VGYTTEFEGVLKFTNPLTAEQEIYLTEMLGIDPDDKPQFKQSSRLSYIQYDLAPDKSGIQWDGNEKFYYAENACNFIIENMKARFPDFGLVGELLAQGEEFCDIWMLAIVDGVAKRIDLKIGGHVTCPECAHVFLATANEYES